jgi:hypothetical protein
MSIKTVQVREFECERCGWKWVSRINGKDIEVLPRGCAKCKSRLWNTPRQNRMLLSSFWLARKPDAKNYVKQKFLDLYSTKTDEEWYNIGSSIRDDISRFAFELKANDGKRPSN